MKLYTEEVLRNSMNSVKYYMEHYDANVIDSIIDKHLKALQPIKLPSDEEIQDKAKDIYPINVGGDMWMANRDEVNKGYKQEGFTEGVKWLIEQIKQQDK